jgi:hypothetical protein
MKKFLIFILAITAVSLTSCLKDKPNTDFSLIKGQTVVELPWSGLQYFSKDAITDNSDTIVMKFGVNIASTNPLSTPTNYTVAIDYSLMDAVNNQAGAPVNYLQMPAGTYTISKTSGTIAAGKRLDSITVTFYKNKLDPSKSYMLPIKLASASNGILSGNFNAHYYHFIGNDFAGTYKWNFQRYNASDSTSSPLNSSSFTGGTATFLPVSPNEFTVVTGYLSLFTYDVTFTKTGSGPTATYSNFQVQMTSNTNGTVTIVQAPVFLNPPFDPAGPLTFAQALKMFHFQYVANNGSADRYITDTYYK